MNRVITSTTGFFYFFLNEQVTNPFLCATGVVILQCCIIITMLPPHLTLQMEISVVAFP